MYRIAREKIANTRRLAKMQHDESFAALEGFGFSFTKKTRPDSRQSLASEVIEFDEEAHAEKDAVQAKFKYMLVGGRWTFSKIMISGPLYTIDFIFS